MMPHFKALANPVKKEEVEKGPEPLEPTDEIIDTMKATVKKLKKLNTPGITAQIAEAGAQTPRTRTPRKTTARKADPVEK